MQTLGKKFARSQTRRFSTFRIGLMAVLTAITSAGLSGCTPKIITHIDYMPSYYSSLWNRQDKIVAESTPACTDYYNQIARKGYLDIRVAFGYKDARPARFVGDFFEKSAYVQQLLRPCPDDKFRACGFRRSLEDADLFTKIVSGPGGGLIQVQLRVTHSSVSSNDDNNRKNPFQKWQSNHSWKNFEDGLKTSDVVFYVGHSRDGGGPDFSPPKLTLSGDSDLTFYQRYTPGLEATVKTLKLTKTQPSVLGLFSCISSKHFSETVLKAAPNLGLITSPVLLYYADALQSSLGALNGILNFYCEKNLKQAIATSRARDSSHLENFFKLRAKAEVAKAPHKAAGKAGDKSLEKASAKTSEKTAEKSAAKTKKAK